MPGNDRQRALLADWQELSRRQFGQYADTWANGQISLMDFELLFKQELKDLYIATTWTATGGIDQTSQSAYGRAGRALRDQYSFMDEMFQAIGRGELSMAQIKDRMGKYTKSADAHFERVVNADKPQLPHVPRDGSTRCVTNCNCGLEWEQVDGGWDVVWRLRPGESCPDCVRRNGKVCQIRNGQVINPTVWD